MLRGDTDFSLTTEFDRWDADGVRFVFGYDANANLVQAAERQPEDLYHELVAKAEREIATRPRTRPTNVKDDIVRHRGYKTIRTQDARDRRVLLPAPRVQAGLPRDRLAQASIVQ